MTWKTIKKYDNEKGISLVELVVAVSIFSSVMLAATGIFINAIKAQKAIIAKQNVMNNMRYIMEFMVKDIKMAQVALSPDLTFKGANGLKLNIDNNFLEPSTAISFIRFNEDEVKYFFYNETDAGGNVVKSEVRRTNITSLSNADDDQSISSDEVLITGLSFTGNDWSLSTGAPSPAAPFITILIKARAKNGVGGEMELQTGISPRTY